VACIDRFVRFVKKARRRFTRWRRSTHRTADSFCRAELARGVAAKTYNHTLIHLRSVFTCCARRPVSPENPFAAIPLQDGETVFRKPFSVEELSPLEEKAKADPFIYPLIVTGMCTAMRRGDCCTLLRVPSIWRAGSSRSKPRRPTKGADSDFPAPAQRAGKGAGEAGAASSVLCLFRNWRRTTGSTRTTSRIACAA